MTKQSGFDTGKDKPPSPKKSFNPLGKLKNALSHVTWKKFLIAEGVLITAFGLAQCSDPDVNPTPDQIFTKTSADAAMTGAGKPIAWQYNAAKTTAQWLVSPITWLMDGDETVGDPKRILVCHPRHIDMLTSLTTPKLDNAHRKETMDSRHYYDKMRAKINNETIDRNSDTWDRINKGWHPVITYGDPTSDGKLTITAAKSISEQKCYHTHRKERIDLPQP